MDLRQMCASMLTVAVLGVVGAGAALAAESKKPLPTDEQILEINKTIQDVYKDEYLKRGPEERRALAKKLLDDARTTKDGPTQYGMLNEARSIAHQIGDYDIAIMAADQLGANFEKVDGYDLKIRSLTTIRGSVKTAESLADGLAAAEIVVDQAMMDENFDAAQKSLEQVIQFASATKNLQKIADARKRTNDIRTQATAFNQWKAAEERLKSDPEDASAKYQVGSYLCLYKGDWDGGLKLTKEGNDGAWANASKQDLANPVKAPEMMKVADLWYEIGANRETQRGRVWHRAEFWYNLVLPNVDGIQKTRVEKQLENIAREKVPILGTITEATRKALPTDAELKRLREMCLTIKTGGTGAANAARVPEMLKFVRELQGRLMNGLMDYKESDFTARCKADMQIREVLEKNGCGQHNSAYTFLHNQFSTFAAKSPTKDDLVLRILAFERYNGTERVIEQQPFDKLIEQSIRLYTQTRSSEFKTNQQRADLAQLLKDKGVRSKGLEAYRASIGNKGG